MDERRLISPGDKSPNNTLLRKVVPSGKGTYLPMRSMNNRLINVDMVISEIENGLT